MFHKLASVLLLGSVAASSEILRWNSHLLNCFKNVSLNPPAASRQLAILHIAQFEAANTIVDQYVPYLDNSGLLAGLSANPEAAAAQAAHDIMVFLYPSASAVWDSELDDALSAYSGDELTQSMDIGAAAATAIITNRTGDGSAAASLGWTLPSPLDPGVWRPTPPANATYLLPNWRLVKTFGVPDAEEIASMVLPPELFSTVYNEEVDLVRQLGAATGSTRSTTQSLIARVWAAGGGTVTPPGQWMQIAQQVVVARGMTFMQQAQTFAQLGISLADAAIVCWATKYNTQRWRPISAIRYQNYSTWSSYITTPPFPAHTSGHSSFSGAASTVLRRRTGKNKQEPFIISSNATDNRTHTNLAAAAEEAAWSRVYGGIHYESDSTDGLTIGTEIGTYVAKYVIPLKGSLESTTVEDASNSTSDSDSSAAPSPTTTTLTPPPSTRSVGLQVGMAAGVVGILLFMVLYYILFGAAAKARPL